MNTWDDPDGAPAMSSGGGALDDLRREFPSWMCWMRNGLFYARRKHSPRHDDYDAHGDDPDDLREAILLALSRDGR